MTPPPKLIVGGGERKSGDNPVMLRFQSPGV